VTVGEDRVLPGGKRHCTLRRKLVHKRGLKRVLENGQIGKQTVDAQKRERGTVLKRGKKGERLLGARRKRKKRIRSAPRNSDGRSGGKGGERIQERFAIQN